MTRTDTQIIEDLKAAVAAFNQLALEAAKNKVEVKLYVETKETVTNVAERKYRLVTKKVVGH